MQAAYQSQIGSRTESDASETTAVTGVVDTTPTAMRGLFIGVAAVVPFWALIATVGWRLVVAR